MAKFQEFGFGDLMLSIEEIAEIPDDSLTKILKAGSDVAVKAFKAKLQALGHVRTGKLRDSIMTESKQIRVGNSIRVCSSVWQSRRDHHERASRSAVGIRL
jgi:hypothetical protein